MKTNGKSENENTGCREGVVDYLCKMFSLAGKKAVITGGSGVLGTDMACAIARAGADVVLWASREGPLQASTEYIRRETGRTEGIGHYRVDLMNENETSAAVDAAGDFQILINACGGGRGKSPLIEQEMENFRFVMKLNVEAGCFLPMKLAAKRWIEKKIRGCIINIASMGSYVPLSGVWAYSAAKAAVVNLTEGAAKEFAPYGIRVNAISAGPMRTLAGAGIGDARAMFSYQQDHAPLRRTITLEEVGGAGLYLLSPLSGGVTGEIHYVDSGYNIISMPRPEDLKNGAEAKAN